MKSIKFTLIAIVISMVSLLSFNNVKATITTEVVDTNYKTNDYGMIVGCYGSFFNNTYNYDNYKYIIDTDNNIYDVVNDEKYVIQSDETEDEYYQIVIYTRFNTNSSNYILSEYGGYTSIKYVLQENKYYLCFPDSDETEDGLCNEHFELVYALPVDTSSGSYKESSSNDETNAYLSDSFRIGCYECKDTTDTSGNYHTDYIMFNPNLSGTMAGWFSGKEFSALNNMTMSSYNGTNALLCTYSSYKTYLTYNKTSFSFNVYVLDSNDELISSNELVFKYGIHYYLAQDNTNPEFNNSDVHFVTLCSSPSELSTFISKISATDETSGDVSSTITILDSDYTITNNYVAPGTYYFNVSAVDEAGNIGIQKFYIDVVIPKPSFNNNYLEQHTYDNNNGAYNETYVTNTLIDDYYFTDSTIQDYYGNLLRNQEDYSNYCHFDLSNINYPVAGTYTFTFYVEIVEGYHSDTYTDSITIIDKTNPIVVSPTTYNVSISNKLNIEGIKSIITATDESVTPTISIIDTDDYTNSNSIGNYAINYTVSDGTNEVTGSFTLVVVDDKAPIISVDSNYVIIVSEGTSLTTSEILSLLKQTGQIETDNIVNLESEYFGNENTPGSYLLKCQLNDNSIINFKIEVKALQTIEDDMASKGNWFINTWNKICSFCKKVITNISNFFRSSYNFFKNIDIVLCINNNFSKYSIERRCYYAINNIRKIS